MSDDHEIQQYESSPNERRYFSIIPHIADDDLDLYEMRLYVHYVRVCGMGGGVCQESLLELAEKLGMGKAKLIEARTALVDKGFIRIRRVGHADAVVGKGETYAVSIADKWRENVTRYYVPDEDSGSIQNRTGSDQNRTGSIQNQKDKEVKKEEVARPATLVGTQHFQEQITNESTNGSKPLGSTKLAEYIEATTTKTLTATQRGILAKKVKIHSADASNTEYQSPEYMYVNQRGFSEFAVQRVEAYKRDNWENLTNMVKDIANYGRNNPGGQPGWLVWKDKRQDLTAPLPQGAAIPAHEQRMLDQQPEITGYEESEGTADLSGYAPIDFRAEQMRKQKSPFYQAQRVPTAEAVRY